MPFVPIVHIHIPMKHTDLSFQALAYEVPLYKERWENHKDRRKEEPLAVNPLPTTYPDAAEDPYKRVASCDAEIARLRKQHGDKVWAVVYSTEAFRLAFEKVAIDANPWISARDEATKRAEAEQTAMNAVETAKLVHQATKELAKAEAEVERENAESLSASDHDELLVEIGATKSVPDQPLSPRRGGKKPV